MNDEEDLGRLYRFDSVRYSLGVDEWENPIPGYQLVVRLYTYPIVKRTDKGVWINASGGKRFIRNDTKKRFGYPTEEEAKEGFIARKKAQIRILAAQLKQAETEMVLIRQENKSRIMLG